MPTRRSANLSKRSKTPMQLDDTLLCIFADHGEAFYQHAGNYLHALQLYEENVAIPFIIYNRKLFAEKESLPRHLA
jgi:arylsulfatase A-like enzyme